MIFLASKSNFNAFVFLISWSPISHAFFVAYQDLFAESSQNAAVPGQIGSTIFLIHSISCRTPISIQLMLFVLILFHLNYPAMENDVSANHREDTLGLR